MPLPPLSFLLDASHTSLQDLELASLNRSANLGKSIKRELDDWIEQSAAAMVARWMLDNREALLSAGATLSEDVEDLRESFQQRKSA